MDRFGILFCLGSTGSCYMRSTVLKTDGAMVEVVAVVVVCVHRSSSAADEIDPLRKVARQRHIQVLFFLASSSQKRRRRRTASPPPLWCSYLPSSSRPTCLFISLTSNWQTSFFLSLVVLIVVVVVVVGEQQNNCKGKSADGVEAFFFFFFWWLISYRILQPSTWNWKIDVLEGIEIRLCYAVSRVSCFCAQQQQQRQQQ